MNLLPEQYYVRPRAVFLTIIILLLSVASSITQQLPIFISHQLTVKFAIHHSELFAVSSNYFMAYFAGLLVSILIVDVIGAKYSLMLSTLMIMLGTYLFFTTLNWQNLLIGRMIQGFFTIIATIASLKLISNWLPKKFFSIFIGLNFSLYALVTIYPLQLVVETLSFSAIGNILIITFFGIFLLLTLFAKNTDHQNEPHKCVQLNAVKNLFKNKTFWIICLIMFLFVSYHAFANLFGSPFLQQNFRMTEQAAALKITIFFLGQLCLTLFACLLSQWLYERKLTLLISLTVFTVIFSLMLTKTLIFLSLSQAMFVLGGASAFGAILSLMINDVSDKSTIGIAFGLFYLFSTLGSLIIQQVIGRIYEATNDWTAALSAIGICFLIALIIGFFLKKDLWLKDKAFHKLSPSRYLKSAWAGELSLGRTYWCVHLWGQFILVVIFISLFFFVLLLITHDTSATFTTYASITKPIYGILLLVVYIPYVVFSSICVWCRTRTYSGLVLWKYAARVLVCISLISAALMIFSMVMSLIKT